MLTENQLKIFAGFKENLFKKYTITELKNKTKVNSNNAFSIAIKKFKEEKLIFEEKIGRNNIYSLNLDNQLIYKYIEIINLSNLNKENLRQIKRLVANLHMYNINFYSIIIFGSYAKGEEKKDSDLDIGVIVNKKSKEYDIIIKDLELKSLITLDIHFILDTELIEMLNVNYENLGKEIARKNMPLINSSIFYNLIGKEVTKWN